MKSPFDSAVVRIRLRQTLASRFDEGELRTLCFYLEVDYDDLPGEGKSNKARELVAYFERRGQVSELVKIGKQSRPDIPWGDVLKVTKETSSVVPQSPPPKRLQTAKPWLTQAIAKLPPAVRGRPW